MKKIKNVLKVFKVKSLRRKTKMAMLDAEEAMLCIRDVEDSIAEDKRKHKKSLVRLFKEQRKEKIDLRQRSDQELEEVNEACNNLRREIEEDAVREDVLVRLQDELVAMRAQINQQKIRIRELESEKRRIAVINTINRRCRVRKYGQ
ncbi:PREDICTED: uncharacterized protein LOC108561815 [Nicrophorus vespilloides]|uniref:Uncharacterized protein LOC108561815 n=1 Tax=Nicrophorus vespilloides TaxID=110193 RepID=A0ABM1MLC5_NICVS|nr:PREDICTED: uncharacterized protein LOC108561815 [Nicrophorus vespilloides]